MTERSRRTGRRQFMCVCCGGTFIAWALASAHAADEVVVPVTQEPAITFGSRTKTCELSRLFSYPATSRYSIDTSWTP